MKRTEILITLKNTDPSKLDYGNCDSGMPSIGDTFDAAGAVCDTEFFVEEIDPDTEPRIGVKTATYDVATDADEAALIERVRNAVFEGFEVVEVTSRPVTPPKTLDAATMRSIVMNDPEMKRFVPVTDHAKRGEVIESLMRTIRAAAHADAEPQNFLQALQGRIEMIPGAFVSFASYDMSLIKSAPGDFVGDLTPEDLQEALLESANRFDLNPEDEDYIRSLMDEEVDERNAMKSMDDENDGNDDQE